MEDSMDRFFQVTSIIALRKTEFFNRSWAALKPQLPSHLDEELMKNELQGIIAKMDNDLFLSREEIETKSINPKLDISVLKLDKDAVEREFQNIISKKY